MDAYLQPLVFCCLYTSIIRQMIVVKSSITDIEHSPNHTVFSLPQTHQLR